MFRHRTLWFIAVLSLALAGTAHAGGHIGGHASTVPGGWGNAPLHGLGFSNTQGLGFSNFGVPPARPGLGGTAHSLNGHRGGSRAGYYNPGLYGGGFYGGGYYGGPALYVTPGYHGNAHDHEAP